MKNRLLTLSFREIKKNFRKFLSLAVLSFLGVAVFVGIKSAGPDMLKTVDKYYDSKNMYDIRVISTLGLTDDDVSAINNLDNNFHAYGVHSKDTSIKSNGSPIATIKIMELNDDNSNVILKKGRFPKNDNEIVVESSVIRNNDINIGDIIDLDLEQDDNSVKNKSVVIVGTVLSPVYLTNGNSGISRGSTNIGNGKINYYSYARKDFFNMDYFTEINIGIDNNYEFGSDEEKELLETSKNKIEIIKEEREKARYEQIINEANAEIDKQEKQALDEFEKAKNELDNANSELENGQDLLISGKRQLANSKKELDNSLAEIKAGYAKIADSEEELANVKNRLDSAVNEINSQVSQYGLNYDDLVEIGNVISNINNREELISLLPDKAKDYVDKVRDLFNGVSQIEAGYKEYYNGLQALEKGKQQLDEGYNQYLGYLKQYNNAVATFDSKQEEYNEGVDLYNASLEEYNSKRFDFENNIREARQKVNEVDSAKWYIYDRNESTDFTSYINSVESIKNLAKLFPVVFFAVAIFISLLSMSRMAIEDRGEIGTLKSLGFNNMQIRYKYLIYSLLATLVGGIFGAVFGYYFLPFIIFRTYGMLFEIPNFIFGANISHVFVGIIIAILCICGATIITIKTLVKEKTTDLLRPKAPLKGKTILLERIKPVWNKFSFSNKVTIRNIFRYKKRISMTMVGIVGCTVLLLSGYAIRDSIVDIIDVQYSEVFNYDNLVYLKENISQEERKQLFNNEHIADIAYAYFSTTKTNGRNVTLIALNDDSFYKLFYLKDKDTKETLSVQNGKIIITSKLSKICNLSAGDTLEFTDVNNEKYNFEISSIAQNYLGDYIFMDKSTYEATIGDYKINSAFFALDDSSNNDIVTTKLFENDNVLSVISNVETTKSVGDIFKSLDSIVIILVVFSGALAYVVLSNLSSINISERQREIATLKVLGFNNKEVDNYIIKEEIIITLIGILIGLIVGTWFGLVIVDTIEIDLAEFIKNISKLSYIKTFGFMVLFSLVVNIRVHLDLKKIDMIESLKSIE